MPRSFSARSCIVLPATLPHGIPAHFDAVSIVNQAIKDIPLQPQLLTAQRSSVQVIHRNPPQSIVTMSGEKIVTHYNIGHERSCSAAPKQGPNQGPGADDSGGGCRAFGKVLRVVGL